MLHPPGTITVCGRPFTPQDLDAIRGIIASDDAPNRQRIAARTCELLGWRGLNGRLKEMSCRVALIRLNARGLIKLPPPRSHPSSERRRQAPHKIDVPLFPIPDSVGELEGLRIDPVGSPAESRLWNEAISRFHYLGYCPLPGAQIRYLVHGSGALLAVIGFGASAWKIAPRDHFIGWTHEQRQRRLHLVVNNARFLILPWVHVRNLASWILGTCARRLPADFKERYGYRPVLLETFVHADRYRGTCYAASNWSYVGDTQGRGKLDRFKKAELPVKRIYLYPLAKNFRQTLCEPLPPP